MINNNLNDDSINNELNNSSGLEDFNKLLNREFNLNNSIEENNIKKSIQTLAYEISKMEDFNHGSAFYTLEGIIAELDKKLSKQINLIIHHKDFQQIESAWRGLEYLVKNTNTSENIQLKVFNISKKEIGKTIKKYKGTAWDQSPLFKRIYEDEYGTAGGIPFGTIIGDYYFNQTAPDIEIMKGLSQIAAASHSPFIASSDPSFMNMDSWQELANPRDISKIFLTPEYILWRSFRESEDSRYFVLTMPKILGRLPYGPNTNPVGKFAFIEDTGSVNTSKYCWMNAAYALGVVVNRSFEEYGWCAKIRGIDSGGKVYNLPVLEFPTSSGELPVKCPTEVAITDRREAELSSNGFLPLCYLKNTNYAVFLGGQTVNKPANYKEIDATANSNLSARLPYIYATSRFAHYIKCIVRDKIGSFKERKAMSDWLNNWISGYVTSDPNATEEVKAKYPLADAKIEVNRVESQNGYYEAKFYLRPHYQLEGLTSSLRLVSKIPSGEN